MRECCVSELRCKEIIDVRDGGRFGYVGDVAVDLDSGQVKALIVPGRLRLLGLLGREEDAVIPWEDIEMIGGDIVLVKCPVPQREPGLFARLWAKLGF